MSVQRPEGDLGDRRRLATARDALFRLSGLPNAPVDDLSLLADSIDRDLKEREFGLGPTDLGFSLNEIKDLQQVLAGYSGKHPDVQQGKIQEIIAAQMIFAAHREAAKPRPLLSRLGSLFSIFIPDFPPIATPKPIRKSLYQNRIGNTDTTPRFNEDLVAQGYSLGSPPFEWVNANAGEKLYANDQRLTFSAATPTNKFLYLGISDENLGVILAGQSRTNGEEIAAVGYINPLLLEAGSDIKESLPGVLHSYLDATKPDTRVVAILGGRYPLRGFRRGNFGLRNRYRNTLSSFNRLVEDTLDLSPEVIIGPTPYVKYPIL